MEPNETPTQEVVAAPTATVEADPFALDESKFVALSPEQRAAIDPVLTEWKTKAKTELEKTSKTYQEKYKPLEEKAQALDQLVQDKRFVEWWNGLQNPSAAQPQGAKNVSPLQIATAEQWADALSRLAQGDESAWSQLQGKAVAAMYGPIAQKLMQGHEELRTTFEMKDLFERHPDAKELDQIGQDGDPKSKSHLEIWLDWATENGKPLEEGYKMAKRTWDAAVARSNQAALGMVQEKKQSVTSGPATHQGGEAVEEVGSMEELMTKRMEYALSGQKAPRFVIRQESEQPATRWIQRT